MNEERVPTGISWLDQLIEGGFPRGSLILLAGNPGCGKTVFSVKFLCKGVQMGEPGIYVSFAEGKETFLNNMIKHLGRECEKDLNTDKFSFLDLITVKEEGITTVLESILAEIQRLGAKRLVIDSYSALAQAFENRINVRIVIHTILGKMVRKSECTTILISEIPRGQEQIGMGIEEFVADGVILLKDIDVYDQSSEGDTQIEQMEVRTARAIEILKMRGTERKQKLSLFTLKGGFQCFEPYHENLDMTKREAIPDIDNEHISSGIRDFDDITGGFLKGSFNLFKIEHGVGRQYMETIRQIQNNAILNGRGVLDIPSIGIPPFEKPSGNYLTYKPETADIEKELEILFQKQDLLKSKTGKEPIIFIGLDTLQVRFGYEKMLRFIDEAIDEGIADKEVLIGIAKSGINYFDPFQHVSETYFVFKHLYNSLIMYGLQPKTGIYNISSGEKGIQLTPIV
ncbi:MAG: ATPase domain-containing protein [Candidatus Jordarchaeaceae archaeon]